MFVVIGATLDIDDLPCDENARRQLFELAAAPPAGSLLVITAPGDLAFHAAESFARVAVGPHINDVHLAVPESDRWSVEEVGEQILRPAMLMPAERNFIVVANAEKMAVSAAEHMLKTLEEPSARTLFVFAVADSSELLATILSRAAKVLTLEPSSVQSRRSALMASGLDFETASSIIAVTGSLTALASAAAKDHDMVTPIREALGAQLSVRDPLAHSHRVAAAIELLATRTDPELRTQADVEPARRKKPADALVKARARVLLRALLQRWSAELTSDLDDARLTAEGFAWRVGLLESIDMARVATGAYITPAAVLAPVFLAAAE